MIVLEYEDFTHTGLGLETYTDGVQHPLELRKILIGDLSQVTLITFFVHYQPKKFYNFFKCYIFDSLWHPLDPEKQTKMIFCKIFSFFCCMNL